MWTLEAGAPIPMWRDPADTRGIAAFTTRRGGVSAAPYDHLNLGRSTADQPEAVDENRRILLAALGIDPARLATAGQVHGAQVARAHAPGLHPSCDALLTTEPGLALAVSAADCPPLLYQTPGVVAAAHAGWRGIAAGIPAATLAAVCETAAVEPAQVRVAIGPCIRACCYAVGPEVAERFPRMAIQARDGRLWLDLPKAIRMQLTGAGLPADALADTGACTSCEPAWYYSHRRDRGLTGRLWGVTAISA
jgi:YfiH family protein